jgi:prepilin-type N-terminal cleavage/methylation domain-containing protein
MQKGITLIELMIWIAIIGITVSLIAGHNADGTGFFAPMNTTICKGGFLWNVDSNYRQQQVLNEHGGGIRCE